MSTVEEDAEAKCEPHPVPEPRAVVPEAPRSTPPPEPPRSTPPPKAPSSIQVSELASAIYSTPVKLRGASTTHTHESVDREFEWDLDHRLFEGIKVEDFMKICFKDRIDRDGQLLKKLRDFSESSSKVKHHVRAYRNIVENQRDPRRSGLRMCNENTMYDRFVDLGNTFLGHTETIAKETNIPEKLHSVSLLVTSESRLAEAAADRKPDVVLIPSSAKARINKASVMERRRIGTNHRVHTSELLVSLEFKRASKRVSQGTEDTKGIKRRREDANHAEPVEDFSGPVVSDADDDQLEASASAVAGKSSVYNRRTITASAPCGLRRSERLASKRTHADGDDDDAGPTDEAGPGKRPKSGQGVAMEVQSASLFCEDKPSDASQAVWLARKNITDPLGRLQLANYAAEQMSSRGDRAYTFGVRVIGSSVMLCYYDRSAIVEAEPFDLLEDPAYLGWFLAMFQDDPSTYGFNAMMGYQDPSDLPRKLKNGEVKSRSSTLKMGLGLTRADETYNDFSSERPNDIKLDELEITSMIVSQYCLVGRGTFVFKARAAERDDLVVKFCWQPETRGNEWEFMQIARRAVPENVPEVFGFANLKNLTPVEKLVEKCNERQGQLPLEKKHFRVLVMKYYKGVENIENEVQFLNLMVQCAECTCLLSRLVSPS